MYWLWASLFVVVVFSFMAYKPRGKYKELSNIVLLQFDKAAQPQAYGQVILMYEYAGVYLRFIFTKALAAKRAQSTALYLHQLDTVQVDDQVVTSLNRQKHVTLVRNHLDYHNTIAVV